jgi:hypothetical protein
MCEGEAFAIRLGKRSEALVFRCQRRIPAPLIVVHEHHPVQRALQGLVRELEERTSAARNVMERVMALKQKLQTPPRRAPQHLVVFLHALQHLNLVVLRIPPTLRGR